MRHQALLPFVAVLLLSVVVALGDTASSSTAKYGLKVTLPKVTSWETTRHSLRLLSCAGFDTGFGSTRCVVGYPEDTDFVPTSTADSSEFVVNVQVGWVVYNALGAPEAILPHFNISGIESAYAIPQDITARGKHLVKIETSFWRQSNGVSYAWFPWPQWSIATTFGQLPSTVELVNASTVRMGSPQSANNTSKSFYVNTFIFAVESLTVQMEISGIDFDGPWGYQFLGIWNAALYPASLTPDELTIGYDNRVEISYMPKTYHYESFDTFAAKLSTIFDLEANMNVSASSMTLVAANSTALGEGSVHEAFTVSFKTTNEQQKLLAISKLKDGMTNLNGIEVAVAAVPSPGPTNPPTPIPEPWGEGYILADLFSNSDCSGTAMPAAINSGCAEGRMFMCVDDQIIKRREFSISRATCNGNYTDSTANVGDCLLTSSGTSMKVKGCAPLGQVPTQTTTSQELVCMDNYMKNPQKPLHGTCYKKVSSVCYKTNTCFKSADGKSSSQFSCYGNYDATAKSWDNPTCDGPQNSSTVASQSCSSSWTMNGFCYFTDAPITQSPTPQPKGKRSNSTYIIVIAVVAVFVLGAVVVGGVLCRKKHATIPNDALPLNTVHSSSA